MAKFWAINEEIMYSIIVKLLWAQWIARSQNMGSNLDPDLLPKKRSDPIPIRSFPIFHWRSFQIFSDPFRSFPIYQPWVFTIFIIVKIYFNNLFGNWYMSKISMHQNIYHPYLILEKLAQKMEKEQKFIAQKAKVYNIRSFPIFPIPISEY